MASRRDRAALRRLPTTFRYSHARRLVTERQLRDLLEQGLLVRVACGVYRTAEAGEGHELIEVVSVRSSASFRPQSALPDRRAATSRVATAVRTRPARRVGRTPGRVAGQRGQAPGGASALPLPPRVAVDPPDGVGPVGPLRGADAGGIRGGEAVGRFGQVAVGGYARWVVMPGL